MKRILSLSIMALAAAAIAATVAELPVPAWPMTAGADIRSGEPVGVASGKRAEATVMAARLRPWRAAPSAWP